jgi:subtilisin family serine protease
MNLMDPLDLIKLSPLMELESGKPEIIVGLIDGPVAIDQPALQGRHVRSISRELGTACVQVDSAACIHGTFVAGILCARRGFSAPAICPNCTLLVRPIFGETTSRSEQIPSATPGELATAIAECVNAGARILNLSVALAQSSIRGERELEEALNYTMQRGVITVVSAGNQGIVGSSIITRHNWVIPVIACDLRGRPLRQSNLGSSIGKRGLSAPGDGITSLGADGKTITFGGTSIAAPFVTGAVALLWSLFPAAAPAQVKLAVTQSHPARRVSVVPPLLDAWAAYQVMRRQV